MLSDEDKKEGMEGVYISTHALNRYAELALRFGSSRVGSHEGELSSFWYDNTSPTLSMKRSLIALVDAARTTLLSCSSASSRKDIILFVVLL